MTAPHRPRAHGVLAVLALTLGGGLVACGDERECFPCPRPHLPVPVPVATEGQPFSIDVSDPDFEGDPAVVYGVNGMPDGATFDAQRGVLVWTPTFDVASPDEATRVELSFTATKRGCGACGGGGPGPGDGLGFDLVFTVRNDEDRDGEADDVDVDVDGDGLSNTAEAALGTSPSMRDTDSDGADDGLDVCPTIPDDGADSDGDDMGDACDICPFDQRNDPDDDLVCDATDDNCPGKANPREDCDANGATPTEQCDEDEDGLGDACDACLDDPLNDGDYDGVCDGIDPCPTFAQEPESCVDAHDPSGVFCDADADDIGDGCDLCPLVSDDDADHDGVCAAVDDCDERYDPPEDCDHDPHTPPTQCDPHPCAR